MGVVKGSKDHYTFSCERESFPPDARAGISFVGCCRIFSFAWMYPDFDRGEFIDSHSDARSHSTRYPDVHTINNGFLLPNNTIDLGSKLHELS